LATNNNNGANLGFENQLWAAADKMRGHMDASEYKHVVLGLIFLKYISDAFQAKYIELEATKESEYTDPEDRDEYAAEVEDDGIPFEEKMTEFTSQLYEQFAKADQLEAVIKRNLEVLGYGE
jgi:type I restriction-modification system DNA methylase subunit